MLYNLVKQITLEVIIMKICKNCHLSFQDNMDTCPKCGDNLIFVPNQQNYRDITDHTSEFTAEDISQNKVLAMTPYLLGWIGIIIALLGAGTSPYAAFHVKQALKIQIVTILLGLVTILLCWTFIVPILAGIASIVLFVIQIICFFGVCNGTAKEPAIISSLKFLK